MMFRTRRAQMSADRFEGRPVAAIVVAVAFGALIAAAVVVVPR
jgi:hypothetical protein